MKKLKLFSWICVVMLIITSFVFAGCGKKPNNPNNPSSSDGDNSNPPQVQEVTLKDMRIIYVVNDRGCRGTTIIQLPDKKIMVINPEVDRSTLLEYLYFLTDKEVIDYLIVTNQHYMGEVAEALGTMIDVKNFYRPNIAINFDYWDTTYSDLLDYEIEDIKQNLSPQEKSGLDCQGKIRYNDQYILALNLLSKTNANIVPITNTTTISDSYVSGGNTYSWNLNFYFDPVINPELYGESYWYDGEYSATFDFVYGDYKIGYFGEPTDNMFNKFIERANGQCQNYDLFIAHYSNTDLSGSATSSKNMFHSWANAFKSAKLCELIFNKDNIQYNRFMISTSTLSNFDFYLPNFWKGKTGSYEPTILLENALYASRIAQGGQRIPCIKLNKDGSFSAVTVEWMGELIDESYFRS